MQRRNIILGGVAVVGLGGWALTRQSSDLPFDPMMAANAQEATGEISEIKDMVMDPLTRLSKLLNMRPLPARIVQHSTQAPSRT